MQFFSCIDGSTHETCWTACPDRPEDDVQLFSSCVSNSLPVCDPDCLDSLLDAAVPDAAPGPEAADTETFVSCVVSVGPSCDGSCYQVFVG